MKSSAREAELRAWREAEAERQEKLLAKPKAVTHLAVVTHTVTHTTSSRQRVAKWRKAHGDAAKVKHREYMKRWRRERGVVP